MAYLSRADWGARPPRGTTPLGRVDTVIIHHTAGPSGPDEVGQVQGAQRYHMDTHGWGDLAYHYMVGQSGTIYEGRGYGVMGGATLNWNATSYAICAIGNFSEEDPSPELIEAIAWIITEGINRGFVVENPTIFGHRDAPGNNTGCPGDALEAQLDAIRSRVGTATPPPPAPAPQPSPAGADVRARQDLLNRVGCGPIAVDGIEGPQTRAATACWQRKLGIAADGIWGPKTQAATDQFFTWLASQQPAPAPAGDLAAVAAAIENAKRQVVRQGARGDAVKWVQILVKAKGFDPGPVDGIFGQQTASAIRAFQRSQNLVMDGVVGPRTWAALTA